MDAHRTKGTDVFADLGLSGADQYKYELAFTVSKMIHDSGLSQRDVADRAGWTQSKVSALVNGRLDGISVGKIIEVAQALGYVVKVHFEPHASSIEEGTDTRSETEGERQLATA